MLRDHMVPGVPADRPAVFLSCPEAEIRRPWVLRAMRAARAVAKGIPLHVVEPGPTKALIEAVTLLSEEQSDLEIKQMKDSQRSKGD